MSSDNVADAKGLIICRKSKQGPGGILIATNYPGPLQNINPSNVRLMNVISYSSTDNRHD